MENKFIGQSVDEVKKTLEEKGYVVKIKYADKPKMKTDSQLVVSAKLLGAEAELLVGDFLIWEI